MPISNCIMPVKRHSAIAYVGSKAMGDEAKAAVIKDIMAVGPSVMSFAVPRKQ